MLEISERQISVNFKTPFFQGYLIQELSSRKMQNPQYSLRAFARDLGVDASLLSKVLTGKRRLPSSAIRKTLEIISFTEENRKKFLASIIREYIKYEFRDLNHNDWEFMRSLLSE